MNDNNILQNMAIIIKMYLLYIKWVYSAYIQDKKKKNAIQHLKNFLGYLNMKRENQNFATNLDEMKFQWS